MQGKGMSQSKGLVWVHVYDSDFEGCGQGVNMSGMETEAVEWFQKPVAAMFVGE